MQRILFFEWIWNRWSKTPPSGLGTIWPQDISTEPKKMAFGTLTVFLMNFGLQTQWDYAAIEGNMEGNIKQRMPCSTFFSFGFDSIGRQHKHKGKRKRPETSNPKIKKINLRNRLASIPMHFDCFWRKNWHLQRRLANPPHACVQSQNFKSLCVDLTPQSQLVSQQKLSD